MASTAEGKAVSARNATTHGLFCRQAVLPHLGESPEAYQALLDALFAELPPRNLMERQYLELWAEASWKLRRLSRWEAQLWESDDTGEDARLTKLERLTRLQNTLRRQLDKAVRMLQKDVTDLYHGRVRREVLTEMGVTEQDCRRNKHEARLVGQLVRAEWQNQVGESEDRLDALALDNQPPDATTGDQQSRQNEPIPDATPPAETDDAENCQNELLLARPAAPRTDWNTGEPIRANAVTTFTFRQPSRQQTRATFQQFARTCAQIE